MFIAKHDRYTVGSILRNSTQFVIYNAEINKKKVAEVGLISIFIKDYKPFIKG